ncbi:TerB family tellurite resistance protein, partial [Mesorhizobium sp. M7A.F.Ca.CA.001.05.1.1]|uniref:TerB family tellurite resistance protein n=1 Tax=Mesorhizobium sp. M7A.F.Ca.CA.001.05.1.1 TaxID=2496721 RepID=UPI000FD432C9
SCVFTTSTGLISSRSSVRRRQLAKHMAEIAKADSQLAESEIRLLRRTLDLLDISPVDVVKTQE